MSNTKVISNAVAVAKLIEKGGTSARSALLDMLQEHVQDIRELASSKYLLPFKGRTGTNKFPVQLPNGKWISRQAKKRKWVTDPKFLTQRSGKARKWLTGTVSWTGNDKDRKMRGIEGLFGRISSIGDKMVRFGLDFYPTGDFNSASSYVFYNAIGRAGRGGKSPKRRMIKPAFGKLSTKAQMGRLFKRFVEKELIRQTTRLRGAI